VPPSPQDAPTGAIADSSAETIASGAQPAHGTTPHKASPLTPGAEFGARYRILRVLGAGGMGIVYQAWDDALGVAVALKVIRPEVIADPAAAEDLERRFKRELLLARQVTHRNVVRIHDLGEVDGIKYITMPYLDGSSLGSLLAEKGKLTVAEVLPIARDIAAGLIAAHEAGVVHRDLKPANIMLESDGPAVIMDFGISRSAAPEPHHTKGGHSHSKHTATFNAAAFAGGLTVAGTVVGTLDYMAPEQARAEPVDQRADIYSFGMIVRDMLLGLRHLTGFDAVAEVMERIKHAPPALRTIDETIPEPVDRIVSRCLEPDPGARYQTTHDLLADLERLDEAGELLPEPRRFTRRHAIAAVALLAAVVTGTWWLSRTPAPEVQPPPTSVLIANFENRAKDPLFDAALEQALSIAIERASFITSYRRDQALRVAAQLNAGKTLDESTARLISRREGIRYVLSGIIEASAGGYKLTLTAIDPADGKAVTSAEATPKRKEEVLGAVAALASEIREALGDTKAREQRAADAETFTATSLDAMAAYARGQELNYAGRQADALKTFQDAVRLDPGLARAYSGMGVIYGALKQDAKVEESYQNALKHLDRMTEREKFRTLGGYYLLVTHNYEKAIDNYVELVDKYPADESGHANLAYAYLNVRDVPKAVEEGRKAIDIYPRNTLQRTNYAMYAMYAGDFKTAMAESYKVLEANPSYEYAMLTVANSQVGAGELDAARQTWERLRALSPLGASMASLGRADLEMHLGRPREAAEMLVKGSKADEAAGSPGEAAAKYLAHAEALYALGNRRGAAAAARKAASLRAHESVLFPAAVVLIDTGDVRTAKELATQLNNRLQSQTSSYAQLINGYIALTEKRLGDALEGFREAQKKHDSWFAHLMLGRAYLEAARFAEAAAEFDACVRRKGEATDVFFENVSTSRYLPPVYFWLGRAQQGLGAVAAAKTSYEQFLKLRAGANPADPLAVEASQQIKKL
jgi:serine/threonine protein kinase/Tfp pilus assembly protein PilF